MRAKISWRACAASPSSPCAPTACPSTRRARCCACTKKAWPATRIWNARRHATPEPCADHLRRYYDRRMNLTGKLGDPARVDESVSDLARGVVGSEILKIAAQI